MSSPSSEDELRQGVESVLAEIEHRQFVVEAATNDEKPGPEIHTLAELLEDPDLLRPPEAVAPRLTWRKRVTLLAAREKRGKSTLGAAMAAAVSRGGKLLGEECFRGPVLWLALEEHPADLVRKLVAFDAEPDSVFILERLRSPLLDFHTAVQETKPALIIVDTLPAFVGLLEERPESGSASDWTTIMQSLTRIARDSEAGLVLIHHADKVHGRYRDSTAIGAGVDVILEMKEDQDHPGVRKIETRARWKVNPWSYRLEGDPMAPGSSPQLAIVEREPTIREQVIAYVTANPGASTRAVREAVSGKTAAVGKVVEELIHKGVIRDLGNDRMGRRLHPP